MATENTHYGSQAIGAMLEGKRHIFFIGIGGINMSALARITASHGYTVSGSDRMRTALTETLKDEGIHVYYSHSPRHIKDVDAVVYTVAIDPDNPELVAAKSKGLPCISRADYLGYLMSSYQRRIGISGMHGKSSCTAMCAEIFLDSDPTVVCGADIPSIGGACRIGEPGKYFLFEACEYMDSFLDFEPNIAVILNIEMDHVDYFHSMEQIRASFAAFARLDDATVSSAGNRVQFVITQGFFFYFITHGNLPSPLTGGKTNVNITIVAIITHFFGLCKDKITSGKSRKSTT